ncbi:MAG: threonine--tRNA ligase [Pseudomonadota bacterium]
MVSITLPDGAVREYERAMTGAEIAASISKSLAKKAIAFKVNGELLDLFETVTTDSNVEIVTPDHDDALELIRHDTAHLLAQAVQELYPGTQISIGPPIEDGFYYDFFREEPFSTDDFDTIEKRMHEIVDEGRVTSKEVWPRDEARAFFDKAGEPFKVELIDDLPPDEDIIIYRHGNKWLDLCRGPHLPTTKYIGKSFKLTKVAGAYWRGDHRNPMLQRIYGTAWRNDKELKAYFQRIEEAEKRDHRKIGKAMQLFHFQEEAAGQVFWHTNGWTLYSELQNYMRRRQIEGGYQEIRTPQLMDRRFWEASGHWDKYRENMFITSIDEEDKVLALKPMSCPCHVQVFNQGVKSYRDLPFRLAEFGSCHRYEPSGALHGLMRVRGFVQDDGHIFCREDQVTDEVGKFCALLQSVYSDLGFDDVLVRFSDRPETRVGSDEVWDMAEASLSAAADATGLEVVYNPGDGAFYGPKLDFVLKDAIGRSWQTGTIQADFTLPERLDATYIGEDGAKHRPVMLHRALLGSFERFLGILIENYAGRFPLWLAPQQVVVTTITSDADEYARKAVARLSAAGLRASLDLRNEKINYKVREHSHAKVPVIAVVGAREAEEETVSLRRLGEKHQKVIPLSEAITQLTDEALAPDLKRLRNA